MRSKAPIEIDIIILSYGQTNELQLTTSDCINSLMASENLLQIKFNVIVVESYKKLKGYQYKQSKTIYPQQSFGFHKYMNLGVKMTKSPYVCLCNNDLLFHYGWASEILNAFEQDSSLISSSPICSRYHYNLGIAVNSGNRIGFGVGVEVAGWCLFVKRDLFKIIGELDENYIFNAADLDYATILETLDLKHALITSSVVDHLKSKTLGIQDDERQDELNLGKEYYDQKWAHRTLIWKQIQHDR